MTITGKSQWAEHVEFRDENSLEESKHNYETDHKSDHLNAK